MTVTAGALNTDVGAFEREGYVVIPGVLSRAEADVSQIVGYPPPAQVLGVLYNAVFLDLIDQDILRLELINQMLRDLPEDKRNGMRCVDIFVLRPSRDLGMMARRFEPRLPKAFRFLTRGLGTRQ